ncbi:UPF0171-domain-containing protein [Ascodesmis nigricans]|uniref:Nitrogen permease regulator 3 n=1 Tax=Ascodesmis nigricans TaxID=341454 RepID=A0A4S2N6A7_9PEZI|nr:UPF0171-domain-containing protein [Ascodesmis nigricans]
MASATNPPLTPNSCLVAILLVIRSSSGSSLPFHFPPRPRFEPTPAASRITSLTTDYDTSTSSSSSNSSSDEDEDRQSTLNGRHNGTGCMTEGDYSDSESRTRVSRRSGKRRDREVSAERAQERDDRVREGLMPWDKFLGIRTDVLAGLLTPYTASGKGKFEISVDDMVFVGQPVRLRPDGTWRKRKKRRKSQGKTDAGNDDDDEGENGEDSIPVQEEGPGVGPKDERLNALSRNGSDTIDVTNDADDEGEAGDREARRKQNEIMSMFHMVFVLNPPELEYHYRVREVYEYVAKRFSRALKYEQAKDGYVSREVQKIMRLKEHAAHQDMRYSELWRQLTDNSSLAYAMMRVFLDISQSRIAHVLLNNNFALSLQIPAITEISVLPSITDPQVPGLPLTTANSFGDEEHKGDTLLGKHFTLLYLEDAATILKDLAAESTEASASLQHFVKSCIPTQSFLTISQQSGIPLHEIQVLARHLVQWRKARAIPPLQARDIYIVSPNADMKRLPQYIEKYRKEFPSLPALPKILGSLSGSPKMYNTIIPTKDHRPAYLDILAWMMKYGLVTQLRSFAWVKVPRSIKLQSPIALPDNMINSTSSLLSNSSASLLEDPESEDPALLRDSFILEPDRASGIESAWLEMMTRNQSSDIKALFERFLKYLNGRHALEKIPVREMVPRKDVRKVFKALDEYIVYVCPFLETCGNY